MALVHRLQQLTGAPVVAVFAERLPRGAGYRGHLRVINGGGMLPEDAGAAATVINQTIEALVSQCPTQYLWGYNRYKQPAGAGAPNLPGTAGTDTGPAPDRSMS
jgi:KDO2-lipid IV(A) lauroyltransferase